MIDPTIVDVPQGPFTPVSSLLMSYAGFAIKARAIKSHQMLADISIFVPAARPVTRPGGILQLKATHEGKHYND